MCVQARPGSTRGSARSDAPSGAQTPLQERSESTAAGNDALDTDCSSGSAQPPHRVGPWKGLAAIFRRRPPPAPSPLAPADSAARLQAQLEQLQAPQEPPQRLRRGGRGRAAVPTDASTQPSMCSTPPSPFADDVGEPSAFSTPRSADGKPGQWVGDEGKEPRCAACNAPLPQASGASLQTALATRDGGVAAAATGQRRSSSAVSDSPSLREWSGEGMLPQQCRECSRRGSALQQRTYATSPSSSSLCCLEPCVCFATAHVCAQSRKLGTAPRGSALQPAEVPSHTGICSIWGMQQNGGAPSLSPLNVCAGLNCLLMRTSSGRPGRLCRTLRLPRRRRTSGEPACKPQVLQARRPPPLPSQHPTLLPRLATQQQERSKLAHHPPEATT